MKKRLYYNSFGRLTPFAEIENIEIDRENNTLDEFRAWREKYDVQDDSLAVWVTRSLRTAKRWAEEGETTGIPRSAGFLILESDDGEDGFILIITDPNAQQQFSTITL